MNRFDRNGKCSKRRGILCPNHACYLDVSKKYSLFTGTVGKPHYGCAIWAMAGRILVFKSLGWSA
jgi:hypothetical protein